MEKSRNRYMVMKLLTKMDVNGVSKKIKDCAGVIPVFATEKEAKKIAGKRYSIITITEHYGK